MGSFSETLVEDCKKIIGKTADVGTEKTFKMVKEKEWEKIGIETKSDNEWYGVNHGM